MQYDIHWIDVDPYLKSGQQPVLLMRRPLLHGSDPKGGLFNVAQVVRTGTYWVSEGDLNQPAVDWGKVNSGDFVRIPVFAYRTRERALASLFGMGVQLGMQAVLTQRKFTLGEAETLTLVIGHECHDLEGACFRCYLGLAVKLKGTPT